MYRFYSNNFLDHRHHHCQKYDETFVIEQTDQCKSNFIDNTCTYLPNNRTVPNTVITQITTIPVGLVGPYI